MRVTELAQELQISDQSVLKKLKALKLKAIDGEQVLNKAVLIVLRSELKKDLLDPAKRKLMARPPDSPKIPEAASVPAPAPSSEEKQAGKEAQGSSPTAAKKESILASGEKVEVKKPARARRVVKKVKEEEPKEASKPLPKPSVKRPAKESPKELPKELLETPNKAEVKASTPDVEGKTQEKVKKNKLQISDAPFVPLKPLAKKKRKSVGTRGGGREDIPEAPADLRPRGEFPSQGAAGEDGAAALSPAPAGGEERRPGLQDLEMRTPITVKDFSIKVQQKTSVVLKKLMQMGVICNINQYLDEEVVKRLAMDFGFFVTKMKTQEQQLIEIHKSDEENPDLLKPRAPVVTLMGHVDHGKTSLLDRIRKSEIVDSEHGGITQHIGAYSVTLPKGKITFLDTPGHEAFTAMRARGAHITDIVILVVAADEGIMPQTEEAIDHARAAGVPIVVALNKIDRRNADIDRVKKQLADHGLTPEDWGGKTIVAGLSAVTGEGVDHLLEMLLLEAEMLELKANKDKDASGIVVEAHLSRGKGAVASLIVQSGTLRLNDIIVVGPYYGKVKAMFDDHDHSIQSAGPSTPIEIMGLPGVPEAGEPFYVVQDEKQAKEISSARLEQLKKEKLLAASKRVSLEDLYSQIQEGRIKELNVILKGDVQGSVEALRDSLEKIPSTEVKVKFIHTGVGDVNSSDVILAVASNAIIIAFNVGVGARATIELEKQPVDVREYRIIYDAVNDVRKALEGMLTPKVRRRDLSQTDVRQVFKLSRSGIIAGCYVTKGKVTRKADIEVVRDGKVVFTGTIGSLKRFKDDVREVTEGYECGISINGFDKIEPGDKLVTFELETIARTL